MAGRSSSTHRSTESYQSAAAEYQPSGGASVSRDIEVDRSGTNLLGAIEKRKRATINKSRSVVPQLWRYYLKNCDPAPLRAPRKKELAADVQVRRFRRLQPKIVGIVRPDTVGTDG